MEAHLAFLSDPSVVPALVLFASVALHRKILVTAAKCLGANIFNRSWNIDLFEILTAEERLLADLDHTLRQIKSEKRMVNLKAYLIFVNE